MCDVWCVVCDVCDVCHVCHVWCVVCGVFGLTVVNHALFSEDHEQPVDLEHSDPRRDHHRHLTRTVEVPVDVMFIENCTTNTVEFRQLRRLRHMETYQLTLLLW